MLSANLKIIQELKEFISIIVDSPELLKHFSLDNKAFTRNRKLPFERIVFLILKLCKKTLSVELDQFFEELNIPNTCSVSAFSQQRMKLNPQFYTVWNELLCICFYHYYGENVKRWNGYRIIAGDGSCISLVNTPKLEKYFGQQSNHLTSYVQAQAFYFYDVLNELTIHSKLSHCKVGELSIAYPMIENLKDDMLMIYDRNFCSYKMMALHLWQEKEVKFVIRGKESLNIIKSFIQSGKQSSIINYEPSYDVIKDLNMCGYKITRKTTIKIRLIRVELESTVEVIVTNLWEDEGYPVSIFKELYFKRWGVEINISRHKNILQLESFSGLTPNSVEQDFFATAVISNLFSILAKEAQNTIDTTIKNKYPMKINGNKALGKIRSNLIELFLGKEPEVILQKLYLYFIREPLPIRTNRSFPRIIKNKRTNSKHKTFTNYKPAY